MRHAPPTASARVRHARRGRRAPEFAVVLPVLMTVVLGTLDFGRFAYHYIGVTNAARAGAAFGCMHAYTPAPLGRWHAAVAQAAGAEMQGQTGYVPAQLAVTAGATAETGGLWRVRVTASYP